MSLEGVTPIDKLQTAPSREVAGNPTAHLVQFYEDDGFLLDSLGGFVAAGLEAGAALVVATRPHLEGLERRLAARGLDVPAVRGLGRYVALDAAEVLERITEDGAPDAGRFFAVVGTAVAEARTRWGPVRVFGEMVGLLAARQRWSAAVRLEELWNELGRRQPMSLLCAYPLAPFGRVEPEAEVAFLQICAQHLRCLPAESYSGLASAEDRRRRVAHLQQREATLEAAQQQLGQLLADQRSMREAIEEGQQAIRRLAAIVEGSEDAIVSKTLDGVITSWNRGAERIFGYTAGEAVGRPITLIIPPELHHQEVEVLGRVRRGQAVEHFETVRVRKDGQRVEISLTVSPVRDEAGRIVGASKIARDISERKRFERERAELLARERAARAAAETASRSKDEFLAVLSHELRTPLNAVLGWVRMLRAGTLDPPTAERGLAVIERSTHSLGQLVSDLVDVSRIVAGRMSLNRAPVDLVPVVRSVLESLRPAAQARRIGLSAELPGAPVPLVGDADRLQQVVWNLVSNAVKFTPEGGRVEVRLDRAGARARLVVADTGQGIAPDFLPHLFERFRQADSGSTRAHAGLGLGLAIVRHLVELHGGTVTAASPGPGQGATFAVELPVTADAVPVAGPAERAAGAPGALAGLRVLIVDDSPDTCELLRIVAGQYGAETVAATSAREALHVLEAWTPDLMVCDIAMPEMDGHELIRQVRVSGGLRSRIPAVALTAYARPEDRERALASGFDAYLTKPAEPGELVPLLARIARIGDGRSGPGP